MSRRKLSKTYVSNEVFFIDGFVSEAKCRDILEELKYVPWQPSLTYRQQVDGSRRNQLTENRVSETAHQKWFGSRLNTLLRQIELRLQRLFALEIANLEYWQATNYQRHGKFDYHLDAGYWSAHYAGERILTFLLYLDTPLKGGGTHFRALDINVESRAGRLLVWENLFPNGNCNHRMIHSATPVLSGQKTTLVTWQRQRKFRIHEKRSRGGNNGKP
jgi:prolyl 4-hydroxylase